MYILGKSRIDSSIAMFSLKTLHPGGIRTRVFCSWDQFDVHRATPPGRDSNNIVEMSKSWVQDFFKYLQVDLVLQRGGISFSKWTPFGWKTNRLGKHLAGTYFSTQIPTRVTSFDYFFSIKSFYFNLFLNDTCSQNIRA
jgi:hypothetical protein